MWWTRGDAIGPGGPLAMCMPTGYCRYMRRTALFLKEAQLKKLLALSEKLPLELVRRAVDA